MPAKEAYHQWGEDPLLAGSYHLARLMDAQFRIPGTRFRFGLDPLLGLVPGWGDAVSMLMQLVVVISLLRHGFSGKLLALMLVNVLLDTLLGSIPLLGQVGDFFYRSSLRNLRLMYAYREEGRYRGSGWPTWLALVALVVLTLAALIALMVWTIRWLGEILF